MQKPLRLVPTVFGDWDDTEETFESVEGILLIDAAGTHIATFPGAYGEDEEGMENARRVLAALS